MKKLLSSSFVMLAGVASLPTATSPWQGIETPAPDYRDDARFHCIRRFFQRYQCPAEQVAETFLEASDRYHLDWRLLPSLSFVESTGGKLARNNNLFGWGSGRAAFDSVTAGI